MNKNWTESHMTEQNMHCGHICCSWKKTTWALDYYLIKTSKYKFSVLLIPADCYNIKVAFMCLLLYSQHVFYSIQITWRRTNIIMSCLFLMGIRMTCIFSLDSLHLGNLWYFNKYTDKYSVQVYMTVIEKTVARKIWIKSENVKCYCYKDKKEMASKQRIFSKLWEDFATVYVNSMNVG